MPFDPNTDVSQHVSPTLHPKALGRFADHLDVPDTPGQPFYAMLQRELSNTATVFHALGSALTDLGEFDKENINQARRRQNTNGPDEFFGDLRMLNGRLKVYSTIYDEYADTSDELVKDVQSSFVHVRKNFEGTTSLLCKKISDDVFRGAKPHADQAELRAFLLGNFSKPMERLGFIRQQMNDGNDQQLVQAVLSKPAYLTGLDAASFDLLRREAAKRYSAGFDAQHSVMVNEIEGILAAWQHQIGKRNEIAASMRMNAKSQAKKTLSNLQKLKKP
ncbi:hypothetical protein GC209_13935 [bacterium]|nr:hypothetical protein [bacterium]